VSTISIITDPREPGRFQVYATCLDASLFAIGGSVQASWWISADDVHKLHADLGEKLGATPAVHRVQPDPTFTREPTCWPWCAGATEPHGPDECYAEHSIVALTLEPHLRGETGAEAPTINLDLEVAGSVPVVGVAIGEEAAQHKVLTVAEARQLAASLVDAADLAAGDTAGGAA
jgi:hypothetical protein